MSKFFEPSLSHRFLATFFIRRIPSPIDLRFQRISGLGRELSVHSFHEGGENVGSLHLPERITHGNLVLERGVMPITPLSLLFNKVLGSFESDYVDVVVLLLNGQSIPICSWIITDALPVKWQAGELDAQGNAVLINTLELAYNEIRWIGVYA